MTIYPKSNMRLSDIQLLSHRPLENLLLHIPINYIIMLTSRKVWSKCYKLSYFTKNLVKFCIFWPALSAAFNKDGYMIAAIVDDFSTDCKKLVDMLEEFEREYQSEIDIHTYSNSEALLTDINMVRFDIIFLDVYMDGLNGMECAERIRQFNSSVLIVFVTTSTHFAVKGYKVRAFDYILKPFDYGQIKSLMLLACKQLNVETRYIQVKEGRWMRKIRLSGIYYVDYYNHYIQIHTESGLIKTYMSFAEFSEILLKYPMFICCYRNILINMDFVDKIEDKTFVLKTKERIPINRIRHKEIKQAYADYLFDKMDGRLYDAD